jgi:hypothetical protein
LSLLLCSFCEGGTADGQKKKKPQTLPELYAAKEEAEEELKKAKQKEKMLRHQLTKLTRQQRKNAPSLHKSRYVGELLPNPELLTDDEVIAVLKIAFQSALQ